MPALTSVELRDLIAPRQPPCVSVYLHVEKAHPANQQNPIRYRDLLRAAEETLRQSYTGSEVRGLMDRFRSLGDAPDFWLGRPGAGLAVFGAADFFRALDVPCDVRDRAVVGDIFHVKRPAS